MPVTPFTASHAAALRAAAARRRTLAIALILGWGAAFAVALVGDDAACTPADPSICGPDLSFGWGAIALFATPFLIWFVPPAGYVAGVVFAVLDVAYDDVVQARWAFAAHGLACLVALARWARSRRGAPGDEPDGRRVRDVARDASSSPEAPGEDDVRLARAAVRVGASRLPFAAAVALVLLGAGLAVTYVVIQRGEDRHLTRSRPAEATVTAVSDVDLTIDLRVEGRDVPGIDVFDTGQYPVDAVVPVLVDPTDPEWVRLVAEPADHTYWITGAGLAVVLALTLAAGQVRSRRRTSDLVLLRAPTSSALALISDGTLLVWPAGTDPGAPGRPAALVPLSVAVERDHLDDFVVDVESMQADEPWDDEPDDEPDDESGRGGWTDDEGDQSGGGHDDDGPSEEEIAELVAEHEEEFARAWRGEGPRERPRPAVLVGHVREGGWVAAVLDDVVTLPSKPVRATPGRRAQQVSTWFRREPPPWWDDLPDGPAVVGTRAGDAAAPARDLFVGDELPGVAVPAQAEPVASGDLPIVADQGAARRLFGAAVILAVLVAFPVALAFADSWWHRLLAVGIALSWLLDGVARRYAQVRIAEDGLHVVTGYRSLTVAWSAVHGVRRDGPLLAVAWAPADVLEMGPFRSPAWGSPERTAQRLGELIMRMRDDAVAGRRPQAVEPRRTVSVPGPMLGFGLVFAVEAAAVLWWSWAR